MKVCIVGASGKLGQYMVQHALDRGYEVVGVCREQSVAKLNAFKGRISIVPGATNDREVIKRAVAGCDGVLTVLVPMGVDGYSTGTAQAVLDYAHEARLVFSSGWHISLDDKDVYPWSVKWKVNVLGRIGKLARKSISTTRSRPVVASSPATPDGHWCGPATWKRVRAKVFPYGAGTSATRSSRAT